MLPPPPFGHLPLAGEESVPQESKIDAVNSSPARGRCPKGGGGR